MVKRRAKREQVSSSSIAERATSNLRRSKRIKTQKNNTINENSALKSLTTKQRKNGKNQKIKKSETSLKIVEQNSRLERAKTHRLFLVDRKDTDQHEHAQYAVCGTTGNLYFITLDTLPTCTCIDQRTRKRNCKHILFVYLRVLKMREDDCVVQRSVAKLSQQELARLRSNIPIATGVKRQYVAPNELLSAFEAVNGSQVQIAHQSHVDVTVKTQSVKPLIHKGDDCAICFEELDDKIEALRFCTISCGRAVHDECFGKWQTQKHKARMPVTCVYCRAVYEDVDDSQVDALAPFRKRRINLGNFM